MTPEDLAVVHARAFLSHPRPWSAKEFGEFLEMPGILLTGDLRAYVLGRVAAGELEILTVATDPGHLRQGLAFAALSRMHEAAEAAGAREAFLEVALDNPAARALYAKSGYAEVGRRPNYYHLPDGRRVAAVLMRRAI